MQTQLTCLKSLKHVHGATRIQRPAVQRRALQLTTRKYHATPALLTESLQAEQASSSATTTTTTCPSALYTDEDCFNTSGVFDAMDTLCMVSYDEEVDGDFEEDLRQLVALGAMYRFAQGTQPIVYAVNA